MSKNRFANMSISHLHRRYDVVRHELENARREYFAFDYWSDDEYAMRRDEIDELQGLLDQIGSELAERGVDER